MLWMAPLACVVEPKAGKGKIFWLDPGKETSSSSYSHDEVGCRARATPAPAMSARGLNCSDFFWEMEPVCLALSELEYRLTRICLHHGSTHFTIFFFASFSFSCFLFVYFCFLLFNQNLNLLQK